MLDKNDILFKDLEAVRQIPIVDTMLEVICRATGMGFAAVARVTNDRWLACSVRDEIAFGLGAGGELKIETTICNEIRDSRQPVVFDNASENELYANHHTPQMYGLQSYISYPIILKNGEFFGTLCAIDPKPAMLENTKIKGMFALFAELLAFHLQSADLMEKTHNALQETSKELDHSINENNEYQKITNHNLREPLRKISLFTDMLVNHADNEDIENTKKVAGKINGFAHELSRMITDITDFSSLTDKNIPFEKVELNQVLSDAQDELAAELPEQEIVIGREDLPEIEAIPAQMFQLFYHLIKTLVSYGGETKPAWIDISSKTGHIRSTSIGLPAQGIEINEITIQNKALQIDPRQLEKIFDIFIHINENQSSDGYGRGLANCRKIAHYHGGELSINCTPADGTSFLITLPTVKQG